MNDKELAPINGAQIFIVSIAPAYVELHADPAAYPKESKTRNRR